MGGSPLGEQAFGRRSVRIALGVAVTLLLVAPAVVAIVRFAGRSWLPVDDFAITDLHVRDVFTTNTPLTGLYSRPGWNHPGPLMFWLMSAVAAPFGNAAWAVRISGAVIQAIALAWLGWVTWTRGLRTFFAAAAVTALSFFAFGSWIFIQPWNPYIPLTCFILFLFLTVVAADGWFRQLIAMSVLGNVIVQIHISYASFVALGFVWVLGCTLWESRRTRRAPDRWRSTVLISVAVWIVAWSFPIYDAVVNRPGNLGEIARYFIRGNHSSVGLRNGSGIMADEFRWIPNWLGATTRLEPFTAHARSASLLWLLVPVVLLVAGFVAAHHAGSRDDQRRVWLSALLFVVATVAIGNADEPRAYTFGWRAVVAAFIVVSCVWAIATAVPKSAYRPMRAIALGVLLVVVTAATVSLAVSVGSDTSYSGLEHRGPVLGQVMHQIQDQRVPKDSVILLRTLGTNLPSLFDGMVDALDRDGVDVRVLPRLGRVFGDQRTAARADANQVWTVIEAGSYVPQALRPAGARVIASTTPLTPPQEAEIARLQQQLIRELTDAGRPDLRSLVDQPLIGVTVLGIPGVDQAAASRLADLNQIVVSSGSCRCAVVAVPVRPGS